MRHRLRLVRNADWWRSSRRRLPHPLAMDVRGGGGPCGGMGRAAVLAQARRGGTSLAPVVWRRCRRTRPCGTSVGTRRTPSPAGAAHACRPKRSGRLRHGPPDARAIRPVWQWTETAYRPYPGFRPVKGAIGEYNGKFMMTRWCCAGHRRDAARPYGVPPTANFFHPDKRWQFAGLRLARDV